jgi:hypothetical protein
MCGTHSHHHGTVARRTTGADSRSVRVGDSERDAAAAALSDHFALGRLDRDEFTDRLDAALAARTRGDLERVFADLPRTRPRRTTPRRSVLAVPPMAAVVAVLLVAASIAAIATGFPPFFLLALLWVWRGHRHAWR